MKNKSNNWLFPLVLSLITFVFGIGIGILLKGWFG